MKGDYKQLVNDYKKTEFVFVILGTACKNHIKWKGLKKVKEMWWDITGLLKCCII